MKEPPMPEDLDSWTMQYITEGMAITPFCDNCKSYKYISATGKDYCQKFGKYNPSLCLDWMPHKSTAVKAAVCRIQYLRRERKEAEKPKDGETPAQG